MATGHESNAAILRNKGVQVEVAVLGEDGAPLSTSDGDPKTEQRWVRFDSNAIADLEDVYGSLAEFEQAARLTPFKAVRQGLAAAWGMDVRQAGQIMLAGRIGDYSTAVGVALALANGVDPTQAGRLLKVGVKASSRQMEERDRLLREQIEEAEEEERKVEEERAQKEAEELSSDSPSTTASSTSDDLSPGTTGSEAGPESDENTTPSGG